MAMTGLAALLVLPAAAEPVIEVTRVSDTGFQLTLQVDEAIDVDTGQQLLLPMAIRLCDGLAPRFGRYEFSMTEGVDAPKPADSFVLVQDIECGGAEATVDKPPSRDLGDQERSEIEQVARTRTVAYYKALAGGHDTEVFAMLADSSHSASPGEDWRRKQGEFRSEAGALREVDVWRVTVYVDPPGAPEPGIYVATDLEVSYENMLVCGYIVWLEGPDGTLRITRQDTGQMAADVVSRMSDSQLARVRSDFRCRPDTGPE